MRVAKGIAPGDRVLLCFAPGPAFYVAFWGCLRAGVLAVPVYPPDPSKMDKAITKLKLIRDDCDARLCLCDDAVALLKGTKGLFYAWPAGLEWLNVQTICAATPLPARAVLQRGDKGKDKGEDEDDVSALLDAAAPSDIAFLQFTSGSTG